MLLTSADDAHYTLSIHIMTMMLMILMMMLMLIGGLESFYCLRLPRPLVIDNLRRAGGLNIKQGNVCVCIYVMSRPHHPNAVTKLQWFTRSNLNGSSPWQPFCCSNTLHGTYCMLASTPAVCWAMDSSSSVGMTQICVGFVPVSRRVLEAKRPSCSLFRLSSS